MRHSASTVDSGNIRLDGSEIGKTRFDGLPEKSTPPCGDKGEEAAGLNGSEGLMVEPRHASFASFSCVPEPPDGRLLKLKVSATEEHSH